MWLTKKRIDIRPHFDADAGLAFERERERECLAVAPDIQLLPSVKNGDDIDSIAVAISMCLLFSVQDNTTAGLVVYTVL